MSAPTELDREALRRRRLVPLQRLDPDRRTGGPWTAQGRHTGEFTGRERRSQSTIALLSRQFDSVCHQAVDANEIAASLESSGINDRIARERYGTRSVFELADVLYRIVPRRASPPSELESTWRVPWTRHLGRGVLYALPMLPYLAALRLLGNNRADVATLLVASVIAMAANHGVSFVGHRLVGYGAEIKAAHFLRRALTVTILAGAAVMLILGSTGLLNWGPLLIAFTQLVYVMASTVLMVFKRDRLLVFSLVPCVALSLWAVTADTLTSTASFWISAGLILCITISLAAAWKTARDVTERPATSVSPRLIPPEFHRAILHSMYGAVVAGLLMFAVLDSLSNTEDVSASRLTGIGMLPLIASLGLVEWHLYAFRREAQATLHQTYHFDGFTWKIRCFLFRARFGYAAALLVLTVAVLTPSITDGSLDPVTLWRHIGYALLGLAILEATLLVSCGLVTATLCWLTGMAVLDLIVRLSPHGGLLDLTRMHACVFAALALGLALTGHFRLVSPLRHQ